MYRQILFSIIALFLVLAISGCTITPGVPTALPATLSVSTESSNEIDCSIGPASIIVEFPNLVPEGIEFDPVQCRFLFGSLNMGVIVAADDDGTFTTLVDDPTVSSIAGIHLDGRRLLACLTLANGNPGFGIYDADDGAPLAMFDLASLAGPGGHLINDCTVDADGNAYITDSMAPLIFRIAPSGEASIFLTDPELSGSPVGVNGIEFIPDDNVLVVGNTTAGNLFRIPVGAPESFSQVQIDADVNTDGMLLHPSGDLIITGSATVPNGESTTGLIALSSTDGWISASVVGIVETSERPTTSALRGNDIYSVFPFLIEFFTGMTVTQFPVLQVPVVPAN